VRVLAAHGLASADEWLHADASAVVRRALDQQVAAGGTVSAIALAGGRSATSMVAVPIKASKDAKALVALRAQPPFTPADAAPMTRAAELVAAELDQAERAQLPRDVEPVHAVDRFAIAATALLLILAAILIGAIAFGVGTISGLVLAGPIAGVAGGTARGGRVALRLALGLSALAFLDRASAPFLYGDRGDIAFALETGGALVALSALAAAILALRARRSVMR